jgi:putative Ig domain-containing protein
VVIYELDTPVVSDLETTDTLALLASQSLGSLFSAADPANRSITEWQVYNTASSDLLALGGVDYSDNSASSALTATSLGLVSLVAGSTATSDTLEVRAFNGLYWGDWQSLAVTIAGTAPPPAAPPVLESQTASQTWLGGSTVSLTLPAGTFEDPQGETLSFAATLAGGQPLPSWLIFNAATDSFSGTAPITAQTLSITVTATDTSGLSASDTFSASVIGAPTVTDPTANQTWQAGKPISLVLPANTFTDPQGEALTYTATQSNGQALPSWLTFHPATETFSGTAPGTTQNLNIKVTATDSSGLSTSGSFSATVQALVQPTVPGIAVTNPTPNQTWTDSQAVDFVLPSNTFADALGLKMSFVAYEISGPNITSWLRFNPTTDTFFGTPPFTLRGTVELAVIASDSQHMMAVDLFDVTFSTGSGHAMAATTNPPGGLAGLHFNPTLVSSLLAFHS